MPLQLLILSASSGGVGILDATPFVAACTISSNEHGPQELAATVKRSLYDAFRVYDAPGTLHVELNDGAQCLWAGRVEEPGLNVGGGDRLELHAYGYWRALSDTPYTALWSDTQWNRWRAVATSELSNRTPERYDVRTDDGVLKISPKKGETFGGNGGPAPQPAIYSHLYQPPSGNSRQITLIQMDITLNAPAGWRMIVYRVGLNFTSFNLLFNVTSAGASLSLSIFTSVTADDWIMIDMYLDTVGTTVAGFETGNSYLQIANPRICTDLSAVVNTALTANRAAGVGVTATVSSTTNMYAGQRLTISSGNSPSESVIVTSVTNSTQFVATFISSYISGQGVSGSRITADTIIKDMISVTNTANSSQLSSSVSGVGAPGKDITDAVYEDAYPQDIATDLAAQGDASGRTWEIGVDIYRRLWFRVQASRAKTWYVDISDINISRSLDGLRNSAYAKYKNASGATIRSSSSTNATSIRRYGVTRGQAVDAQTTNATIAGLTRDVALAASAQVQPRATFTIRAAYSASGARYPIAYVQAGDILTIRNLPPAASTTVDTIRTFRITRVEYDALANTLTVEPEAPNPTLDALIAGQL